MIDHPILHLDRNKSNSFDNAASPGGQSMVVPLSTFYIYISHTSSSQS